MFSGNVTLGISYVLALWLFTALTTSLATPTIEYLL